MGSGMRKGCFHSRRALITGGSSGIGAAIAEQLARQGASPLRVDGLQTLVADLRAGKTERRAA